MAGFVKPSGGSFDWATDAATPHATVNHAGIPGIARLETLSILNKTCPASNRQHVDGGALANTMIASIVIQATDGAATPALNYDFEIFTDAARTQYAYRATGITTTVYEDKIPWYWEGTNLYINIINNTATAISDLDITIKYRG